MATTSSYPSPFRCYYLRSPGSSAAEAHAIIKLVVKAMKGGGGAATSPNGKMTIPLRGILCEAFRIFATEANTFHYPHGGGQRRYGSNLVAWLVDNLHRVDEVLEALEQKEIPDWLSEVLNQPHPSGI